jgi:uncharacterized cupin superfamily protein
MPSWEPVPEAPLEQGDAGLAATGPGWYVVNIAEAQGVHTERFGDACLFENRPAQRFPEFGINVHVLRPGEPNALYHREDAQEAFLVLSGECVAIVEDEERAMRKGDFLYTPPGTAHVLIGAGDGPCAVLMVGTRKDPEHLLYPVNERAARYGASVEVETTDERDAYEGMQREPRAIGLPW